MRGMRIRALFVGLAALPACSLFVSLDGLSPEEPASSDAGIDGSATDSSREGATNEASIDGGPASDPCTTTHALCENFDEDGGMLSSIWSPDNDHALIDIATDASISPPASLEILAQKTNDYGAIFTTITKAPFPKGLRCDFAMQVDGYPPGSSAQFLDIQITTGDPSVQSYDLEASGQTQDVASMEESVDFLDGGGNYNSKDVPFQVFDGKWHQLAIIITVSGTPTLELDVDGTLGAIEPITPPANLAAAVVSVGFDSDDTVGPVWAARFDNVVCDWMN